MMMKRISQQFLLFSLYATLSIKKQFPWSLTLNSEFIFSTQTDMKECLYVVLLKGRELRQ